MARRSGQSGYIEQKGNAYYVRFWTDAPGQEKRAHQCIRICPASGPGKMTHLWRHGSPSINNLVVNE
jgi:hypothetical protein